MWATSSVGCSGVVARVGGEIVPSTRRPSVGLAPLFAVLALAACAPDSPANRVPVSADQVSAPPAFQRLQEDLFASPGAQPNAWADFDGDGDLDLFVGFRGAQNRLYRNDAGTLVDVAEEYGIADAEETRTAAWGDFDADGDPDLFVGYVPSTEIPSRLYRNEGPGRRFFDVTGELGLDIVGTTRQASWIDFDGDGDLDFFLAMRDQPNRLYANRNGAFVDVAGEVGIDDDRRTVGAVWFDMDTDGDLDLFVANQNGDEDAFYRNDGAHFTDVAPALGMNQPGRSEEGGSVGAALADYDNDGDLDLFVASYGPDVLWQNQGGGSFVDVAPGTPLAADHHSVSAAWGDYDLDGWLDLYVTVFVSGSPEEPDELFRNVGGVFTDVTTEAMHERGGSHGVTWADFDQDGDLDLALANNDPEAGTHPLYGNLLEASGPARSLQVVVLDGEGRWTRTGAEVRVRDSETGRLLGLRASDTGGGYSSQGMTPLHFAIPEGVRRVDVEATVLISGTRVSVTVGSVDPADFAGGLLEVRR